MTAYEIMPSLVGSEMCIRDRYICTVKTNIPSIQLALKLGFTLYAGDTDGMNIYRKKL